MLRQAQNMGLWSSQSDVARLPFPDACFDRIVVDALLRMLKPDIARFVVKLVALAEWLALMGSHFAAQARIVSDSRSGRGW
jgi:hypothetical protein